jgi:predicted dehydrogenase
MNSHSTRRTFLKHSGILAMAAAGTGPLLKTSKAAGADAAAGAGAGGEKKLGFAIVGLGKFGAGQLLRSLPECKYARPTALVSGHPDKAKSLAGQYGIPEKNIYNYENFDSIKDNPDVDVVYVVLPNSMHCEYTVRAAKAGKHVMCEKPMAINAAECQQMVDACKQANRKLMIGYRLRYDPYHIKAIELTQSKKFGPARMIEAGFAFNIGPDQWRADKQLAGGGPVMDLGVYCLNACRYLTGEEPASVSAQIVMPDKDDARFKNGCDAQMAWTMKFTSGVLAACTTSYTHAGENHYTVRAEKGQIRMDPAYSYGGLKLVTRSGRNEENLEFPQINQFAAEMDHFARCVLDNKEPLTPGEEGLKDMKVIDALYNSAAEGKTVSL